MAKPKPGGRRPRKKERKNVTYGVAHIKSSFNNTIVTITDTEGNVISWASAGNVGLQGLAQVHAVRRADGGREGRPRRHGARRAQGRGAGEGSRAPAARPRSARIQNTGIEVTGIKDVTPVPHNGCRPPKRRRV